jgi:phosphoglycerate dehydrogenase-like enzyme
VVDPLFSLDDVRAGLGPLGVEAVSAGPTDGGPGVVAVLTSSDYPMSAETLAALPDLEVIATASVGFEHLPIAEAGARGIWVCNAPGFCTTEVADSTIALILALCRGTVALDRSVSGGAWDYEAAGALRRLRGSRLGLVGAGRIGRAVGRRAAAFGIEVYAHDPALSPQQIEATGARPVGFEQLLGGSDIVSLHVPFDPQVGTLIGAKELALMRSDAVLVNTSRGKLVDVDALLAALEEGTLGGAGLDVLPEEPPPGGAPSHPRLIVTPHAAWYSTDSEHEAFDTPIHQVVAVLSGGRPADGVIVPGRSAPAVG